MKVYLQNYVQTIYEQVKWSTKVPLLNGYDDIMSLWTTLSLYVQKVGAKMAKLLHTMRKYVSSCGIDHLGNKCQVEISY